ncbi:Holliday junction branch migration protein RuvA [Flavilitoribacter nigricans]|uniref:Holliday junction branch migration complex subunit RuvA n=1 Tax=Flavilitoribacter nigricans (strain ATCC 23147 / DSM 23189 / NBRC 102662 / NCIMB 1420 / SS-2) TaxID=1122177 RepID=A0A2D0N599_FLAN2|nr:Holliday junction branch migration protein RuvA [Flavilitoribacter nigricans]PHN03560.1 Holliday junction branch migration protein RuvA [Flavilitoribacter nigricans DSM 23189 = NBRC 102662]
MITYIKGEITFKTPTFIVVETGGLGYHINISLHTYTQIEKMERVKILTHLQIKEDSHTLYGFAEADERTLFVQLISVSGIGTSTAQVLLSAMNPDELKSAIISEDLVAFKRVKGVGPKTAKRIILDLKDKVMKESGDTGLTFSPQDNTVRDEALSALVTLGYNRIQVQKVLNKILKQQSGISSVEALVRVALKQMSG